jgi:hypothetical protein
METNPNGRTRGANASRKNIVTDLNPNRKAATKGGSMPQFFDLRRAA